MPDTINRFVGGRNTDVDKTLIPNTQYIEAHNLELTESGEFYALKNLQGTLPVETISTNTSTRILGEYAVRFYREQTQDFVDGILVFSYIPNSVFNIRFYDIGNDVLYQLYEKPVDSSFTSDDRLVDAVNYPENGIDIVQFTDFHNEVRQLRCVIPTGYTPNFLTDEDLSLLRVGANGIITLNGIQIDEGSLLSGSYQFAYRMVDPTTKTLTKWSGLTNPIHVYSEDNSDLTVTNVHSSVGLPTKFGIEITITPTDKELSRFTHFQLAVIENIGPTVQLTASLLPIEPISELNYTYSANNRIGTITVDELVVDHAAIETAKTLTVVDSRLVLGNVKYRDLEFDNGDPFITGGSVITRTNIPRDAYADHEFSSNYVGYFRDEVYRFVAVYSDEHGHKALKVLDLGSISGNQMSGPDIKFPDRRLTGGDYALFDSNNKIQTLGLQLLGLDNHPTWATSVEIYRAKRIKDILFQSPLVPMMLIQGVGAIKDYPSAPHDVTGTQLSFPDAQPQVKTDVYVPRNFFWPELRTLRRESSGTITQDLFTTYDFSMVFPDSSMYGGTPFQFTGGEKVSICDYAALKLSAHSFTPEGHVDGDALDSSVSGTFHCLSANDYFYNPGHSHSGPAVPIDITDYQFFDNFSEGGSVAGTSVLRYDLLQTTQPDYGTKPDVMKGAVIKHDTLGLPGALSFSGVTFNPPFRGAPITSLGSLNYETGFSNRYITEYPGYNGNDYVNKVAIANIRLGLTDDRYGDLDTNHEFISTGAKHVFTPAELVDVRQGNSVPVDLEVWGGDCITGVHFFKITNGQYLVANNDKQLGLTEKEIAKYQYYYFFPAYTIDPFSVTIQAALKLAVGTQASAQYLELVLESEYNGQVMAPKHQTVESVNNIPLWVDTSEATVRAPLNYLYNPNLNKQNDQKVLLPKPDIGFEQNDFQARILYSDPKIYNSSEQGFDVFRVLNALDLQEKGGPVTKLALGGDNLYAIQEKHITYLPVGQIQAELTDASTIAIGTADFFGRPVILDTAHGSQHMKGVVETGGVTFISDSRNKAVYALLGQQLQVISDKDNVSEFRDFFSSQLPERSIRGIWDPVKSQLWLTNGIKTQGWNDKLKVWYGDYEFGPRLLGGVYQNGLFLIGSDGDSVDIYKMYGGTVNDLMGTIVVPRVTISVNPDPEATKVFDSLALSATEPLGGIDLVVERETSLGDQQSGTIIADRKEGFLVAKALLDANNSRLRGLYLLATMSWGNIQSTLSSLMTRFRYSARTPF